MSNNEIFDPDPTVRIANRHSFEQGDTWWHAGGPRVSPDCQWILILSGEARYRSSAAGQLKIRPGDMLFIPAGETHSLVALTDGALAGFHGEWFKDSRWRDGPCALPFPWRRVTHMPSTSRVTETMTRMATLFASFPPFKAQRLSCLATDVLLQLASEWLRQTQPRVSARTRQMLEWIREQVPRPVDRNAIAERFDLTPAYVNQVFKRELGLTPSQVVRRERCAVGYNLLQEGFSVTATAEDLGFADPFHFSRVFTQVYGINPSQVRP